MIDRTLARYTPPRKAGLPLTLAAVCLVTGFATWLALPRTGATALWRLLAIVPIAVGLGLAMRWLGRCYTYALEQHEDGEVDFVVTTQQGRRLTTACRIPCRTIAAVTPAPKKRTHTHSYCNVPFPRRATILTLDEARVRITPDDDMRRLLEMLCTPMTLG